MKKLELKHLACYLPYGLIIYGKAELPFFDENGKEMDRFTYKLNTETLSSALEKGEKPILIPLSDLDDFNDDGTIKYWSSNGIEEGIETDKLLEYASYDDIQYLLKNHFDIFDLIENNLAIDINDL